MTHCGKMTSSGKKCMNKSKNGMWCWRHRPRYDEIVIIGQQWCGYTRMIQEELESRNIPFQFIRTEDIPEEYHEITNVYPYIPMVFVNGTFIGGSSNTMKYLKDGKIIPYDE